MITRTPCYFRILWGKIKKKKRERNSRGDVRQNEHSRVSHRHRNNDQFLGYANNNKLWGSGANKNKDNHNRGQHSTLAGVFRNKGKVYGVH